MPLARFQFTVVGTNANGLLVPVPSASVEVRAEIAGQPLVQLYSDRAGATPIGNPISADSEAFAYFHVQGGVYQIKATGTITGSPFERIWRYVGIGTANERDFDPNTVGEPAPFTVSAAGNYAVTNDKNLIFTNAAARNITLPPSADRSNGQLWVKAAFDASGAIQTVVPDGSETIDGQSNYKIDWPYGRVKLEPRSDGLGWYTI